MTIVACERAAIEKAGAIQRAPVARVAAARMRQARPPIEIADWDMAWTDLGVLTDGEPFVIRGRNRLQILDSSASGGITEPVPIEVGREASFSVDVSPPLPDDSLLLRMESWTEDGFRMGTAQVDPRTGRGSVLLEDGASAVYVPPGRLLFSRGSTLLGARFDPDLGEVTGRPVALVEGLRIAEPWEAARFSIAADGTLVYALGGLVGSDRRFVIVDPATGAIEAWSEERRPFNSEVPTAVSPDGQWVYAQLANGKGTYEVWRLGREGPAQPVIALEEADALTPIPSPDGQHLAFARVGHQPSDGIYLAPLDGREAPIELLRMSFKEDRVVPVEWTPDGRRRFPRVLAPPCTSTSSLRASMCCTAPRQSKCARASPFPQMATSRLTAWSLLLASMVPATPGRRN